MNQLEFQKQVIREEYGLKSATSIERDKQIDNSMRRNLPAQKNKVSSKKRVGVTRKWDSH